MKVSIPKPCHENWGNMTPAEKGRHCAKCDKVVIDFTQMTDAQIIQQMKKQPSSCGRFHNLQLDRPLVAPSGKQRKKWSYPAAASAAILSQLIPLDLEAQGQIRFEDTLHMQHLIKRDCSIPSILSKNPGLTIRWNPKAHAFQDMERIVLDVDSFQMPLDSLSNGRASISLPTSLEWDSFELHFMHTGGEKKDTLHIRKSEVYNIQHHSIDFEIGQNSGTWSVMQPEIIPYIPEVITMGIPWQPPFLNDSVLWKAQIKPIEIEACTITLGDYSWGWVLPEESEAQKKAEKTKAQLKHLMQGQAQQDMYQSLDSEDRHKWTWMGSIFLGIAAFLTTFILTGKKKDKN